MLLSGYSPSVPATTQLGPFVFFTSGSLPRSGMLSRTVYLLDKDGNLPADTAGVTVRVILGWAYGIPGASYKVTNTTVLAASEVLPQSVGAWTIQYGLPQTGIYTETWIFRDSTGANLSFTVTNAYLTAPI